MHLQRCCACLSFDIEDVVGALLEGKTLYFLPLDGEAQLAIQTPEHVEGEGFGLKRPGVYRM